MLFVPLSFFNSQFTVRSSHPARQTGAASHSSPPGALFCADHREELDVKLQLGAFRAAFRCDAESLDPHDVVRFLDFLEKLQDLPQCLVAVNERGGASLEVTVSGWARGNLPRPGEIQPVLRLRYER